MDALDAARAWVAGWSRAWPAGDAAALAELYAAGAVFRSHPAREPQAPVEYAAWAFADDTERLMELAFGEPVAAGDRAAVEYWAIVRRPDGAEATLAGISMLRFAPDGLVVDQRDYWSLDDGRRPPNFR